MKLRFNGLGAALRKAFGPPHGRESDPPAAPAPTPIEAALGLRESAAHLKVVAQSMIPPADGAEKIGGEPVRESFEDAMRKLAEKLRA